MTRKKTRIMFMKEYCVNSQEWFLDTKSSGRWIFLTLTGSNLPIIHRLHRKLGSVRPRS